MIIFISGPINSGKSTISKLLERKIKNLAVVEVDDLRKMIEWMPLEDAIPINLENAMSVIRTFTKNGLNTVMAYPIRKENHDYLINNLKDLNVDIYIFTLSPNMESILKNRGERKLTEWEIERIKYHYSIGIANPSFGEIIDNTNQTPDETAAIILSKIKQ